jgi:hypothetical protein
MILEAVGVPSNIINVAREIYDRLVYEIKQFDDLEDLTDNPMSFTGDFHISDYKFKEVIVTTEFNDYHKLTLVGMGFHAKNPKLKNYDKIFYESNFNSVEISIQFVGPSNTTIDELLEFINNNKTEMVISLTHELKHAYDTYKKPHESTKRRSEYSSVMLNQFSNESFRIDTLNELLFHMYFIHNVENLVRPSEFAAALEENKITKKEFYNFITNDRVFKILIKIKKTTMNDLKESLMGEIDNIKPFLESVGVNSDLPNEKLVDKTLELFYINLVNWNVESLGKTITMGMSFFDRVFGGGYSDEQREYLIKYSKRLQRFSDNYQDFYETLLRNNSIVANKMIKKISKVYSLINDKTQTNESIKDWELYHKIKGTKSKIVTEFEKL